MNKSEKSCAQQLQQCKRELKEVLLKEKETQQRLNFLENLISVMPGHIYLKDSDGAFLVCNNFQAKDFGHNLGFLCGKSLIGKTDYDLFSAEQASKIRAIDLEVMRTGKPHTIEETVTLPNGTEATYLSQKTPFYQESETPTGILGVSINVTEQKRSVMMLQEEKNSLETKERFHMEKLTQLNNSVTGSKVTMQSVEEGANNIRDYFENLIAGMPGHVYWMDRKNVFLGCNDQQAKSAGLSSRHEIVGKTNYDMLWGDQAKEINAVNDQVMSEGKPSTVEEFAKMASGEGFFLSHKAPLYDKDKKVIGLLGISFDITERKKLEQELKKAKEDVEVINVLKSNFIRNMEHDIRTPFSGIYGLSSFLMETETDQKKKALLADLHYSAKELLEYCNTILDFSNIESENIPVIDKKFNFHEIIEQAIKMERPAAKLKNLDLKITYQDNVPRVLISDSFRLKRVLINLISNAIKFTKEGHVAIIVKLISKRKEENDVILSLIIEDTGVGIPEKTQNRLFERFEKGSLSNEGIHKGHGLGLRIVRQFMCDLKGDIDLVSDEGTGTKVICTIPFKLPYIESPQKIEV